MLCYVEKFNNVPYFLNNSCERLFLFLHQKGVIIWGKAINSREVIISNIDWNIDYLKYFVLQSH